MGTRNLNMNIVIKKIFQKNIRSNSKINIKPYPTEINLIVVYPSIAFPSTAFNIPFNVTIRGRTEPPRFSSRLFIRQLAPPPIHKEQRERNSRAAVTGWLSFKKEWEEGEGEEKKRWHASIDEGKMIHRNERRNRFKVTLRVSLCERRDTWPSTA